MDETEQKERIKYLKDVLLANGALSIDAIIELMIEHPGMRSSIHLRMIKTVLPWEDSSLDKSYVYRSNLAGQMLAHVKSDSGKTLSDQLLQKAGYTVIDPTTKEDKS